MQKKLYVLCVSLCFLTAILFTQALAQMDELVIDDLWGTGQYLSAKIVDDTAGAGATAWQAGTRVYVLKRGGIYPWNQQIDIGAGRTLRIKAEGGTGPRPIIFLYDASGSDRPPGNMVRMGTNTNLYLNDVIISGYNEEIRAELDGLQGGLIGAPSAASNFNMYIDNCILSSTNGNHIRTDGKPITIRVTNTLFADMGFNGRSNFGAGKGIDVRDQDVDTLHLENCTFVNVQDRIVRHYQANKGPIRNFIFNHNTIVNSMAYHGMLSLGRVDSTGTGRLEIKNNLFIDPFALGADTAYIRQSEFGDHGELDPTNNLARMTWIIANPNNAANWDISNNYYAISDSGQAMLTLPLPNGPYYQNEGSPLTWGINKRLAALGKDTMTTFKKITVNPVKVPPLMTKMIRWVYTPRDLGGCGKTKGGNNDPNFTKDSAGYWTYDYNRRTVFWYDDSLDCSYTASEQPVSSDGKVVGSTLWSFLGVVSVGKEELAPNTFSLEQNYPNPFNPSTEFKYTIGTAGIVSIKVYDILGREVATVVNEMKQPGTYTASWNATGFASGVYFYKMQAGSFTDIKKMMLLK